MIDEEGDDDDVREAEMIQIQQQAVESGDRFQYRGTPERERKVPSRNKRRQQAQHRYSQDVAEQVQITRVTPSPTPPPPLPPKQPGGRRADIIDDFGEDEDEDEEEVEAVPVKGILTLEATNGNVHVVKNEYKEATGIQSRPLPAPPAPKRTMRGKRSSASPMKSDAAAVAPAQHLSP